MPATLELFPEQTRLVQFRAFPGKAAVDVAAGIIHGVSVISVGPALGHNTSVDKKGLKQTLEACLEWGEEGVKLIEKHDGDFEDIVGAVKNFRIEGDQLKGDAHILDTFEDRARIFEIAQKLPKNFGLSVETYGEPEKIDGQKFYRCTEIDAIALVPKPAANPTGLFSKRSAVDIKQSPNPNDMTPEEVKTAISEGVSASLKPVEDRLSKLEQNKDGETVTKLSAKVESLEKKEIPSDEKLTKLVTDKVESQLKERGDQIAADAVTKFAASIGVKKVPDNGGQAGNDDTFEGKIQTHLSAGAKGRGMAIARAAVDDPKGYNEWVKTGGQQPKAA